MKNVENSIVFQEKSGENGKDIDGFLILVCRLVGGHPNIIELIEYFESTTYIFLVFELCQQVFILRNSISAENFQDKLSSSNFGPTEKIYYYGQCIMDNGGFKGILKPCKAIITDLNLTKTVS
jgi:serine/threonine protein kinase